MTTLTIFFLYFLKTFLDGNVPLVPSYVFCISQFVRFSRIFIYVSDRNFIAMEQLFQVCFFHKLLNFFNSFYFHYKDIVYNIILSEI